MLVESLSKWLPQAILTEFFSALIHNPGQWAPGKKNRNHVNLMESERAKYTLAVVCPHMCSQCSLLSWMPQVKITQYAKEKDKRELVEYKYGLYLESLRGSLVPS